ncbi:thioredoxin [Arthrobacter sp. 31Y]|uniref:thioredoxin n=1 Tax=Arthrobacter sp. 31Y TaxID=1115632 RepID=UPI000463CFFC|nr:thioredoxin [Arthrobacter sp. 31Y]
MSARHVTDATFESEVLDNERTVLVDFWAEWCPPCRAIGPVIDGLAVDLAGKLDVVKINIDDNPKTAARFQITSIPALKVYRGGEVVKTIIGARKKPELEAQLAAFIR